jgi:phosphatidylserine decarboxylase
VINILLYFLVPELLFFRKLFLIATTVFFLFFLNFFLISSRKFTPDDNLVIAPADGRVVAIEETDEHEYFKEKRLQVSIFMSIWDPHVNYTPVSGTVSYCKHHKGKHYIAHRPKASLENEMNTVVINTAWKEIPEIMIRQIAGAVAQRIVTYLKPNDDAKQGDELGFIKFGSRVDLLLPLGIKIMVNLGEKVKGNQTPVAKIER